MGMLGIATVIGEVSSDNCITAYDHTLEALRQR